MPFCLLNYILYVLYMILVSVAISARVHWQQSHLGSGTCNWLCFSIIFLREAEVHLPSVIVALLPFDPWPSQVATGMKLLHGGYVYGLGHPRYFLVWLDAGRLGGDCVHAARSHGSMSPV